MKINFWLFTTASSLVTARAFSTRKNPDHGIRTDTEFFLFCFSDKE